MGSPVQQLWQCDMVYHNLFRTCNFRGMASDPAWNHRFTRWRSWPKSEQQTIHCSTFHSLHFHSNILCDELIRVSHRRQVQWRDQEKTGLKHFHRGIEGVGQNAKNYASCQFENQTHYPSKELSEKNCFQTSHKQLLWIRNSDYHCPQYLLPLHWLSWLSSTACQSDIDWKHSFHQHFRLGGTTQADWLWNKVLFLGYLEQVRFLDSHPLDHRHWWRYLPIQSYGFQNYKSSKTPQNGEIIEGAEEPS